MLSGKILAVDDEETNLKILQKIFEDEAYELTLARSGEECLQLLPELQPDVVLLDNMMPGMSGCEVCNQIRLDESLKDTKILLISGKGMTDERLEGYEHGADDYVVKPFVDEELEAKAKVFIRMHQAEKALRDLNDGLEDQIKAHADQLVQSEKMASLGQLAAGVAHEINNPVGFVASNLSTLKNYIRFFVTLTEQYTVISEHEAIQSNSELKALTDKVNLLKQQEDLEFIVEDIETLIAESLDGVKRVKEIVSGLKNFAHVDDAEAQEADLNNELEQALKLVWNELKYNCTVEKQLGDLPLLKCYPRQLSQIFMNLMVNASHAIGEQGTITLESFTDDDNIFVRISDTGSGIKQEHLQHLFDPFFTTKPVGKGTGLGLSIAYGIVQKHHGDISVDSALGEGTTFTIKLPKKGIGNVEHDAS